MEVPLLQTKRYFAGTLLERVAEATMVRLVYNQLGWIRRQGQSLHVLLQGYGDPDVQAAVIQPVNGSTRLRLS